MRFNTPAILLTKWRSYHLKIEADLSRGRRLIQLNFLSGVGITTVVVTLLLLCCCVCKKCKCWKGWMDRDCCGQICNAQAVIRHWAVNSSNENLRRTVQSFYQQHTSPSFLSFPASSVLQMLAIVPNL
jgi:hypothetical protein